MKLRIRLKTGYLLLALFCAWPFACAGAEIAAQAEEARIVRVPLFAQNIVLSLPRNTSSFWFVLPRGTVLGGDATLSLHMDASATLIDIRSTITLKVNGEEVSTVRIMDIIRQEAGIWETAIPKELLRTDGIYNELAFVTAQRSIEGDCQDIDNPSNWVKLLSDSRLGIVISRDGDATLDQAYELLFNRMEEANAVSVQFVLSSPGDPAVLAAMLRMGSAIGNNAPFKDGLTVKVSASDSEPGPDNRMYLGLGLPVPAGFSGPGALAQGSGYLEIARNGLQNRLLIQGADREGLLKAVAFFARKDYLSQADAAGLTVNTQIPLSDNAQTANGTGYYTLKDLGYTTINLAGAFHQQVTYTIPQPKGIKSGARSYVEIHFRHSDALIADRSLMTVYLNGDPAGSVKLSASNAPGGKIKVGIPDKALSSQSITLRVDCYNYLGQLDCSKDYSDTAWTVIAEDSVVYLEPGEKTIRPTLARFPILSPETAGEEILMVLPANPDGDALALAGALAVRTGQNTRQNIAWSALDIASLEALQPQQNMVIVGSYDALRLPKALEDALYVAPLSDGTFKIAQEAALTPETLKDKVLIQAVRSPWHFQKTLYVLTYGPGMGARALEIIQSRKALDKLQGHVAVADRRGGIATYQLFAEGEGLQEAPLTLERAAYLIERRTGYPIWVIGLLLAVLALAAVLLVRILRNKARFQLAAGKIKSQNHQQDKEKQIVDGQGKEPPEDGPGKE